MKMKFFKIALVGLCSMMMGDLWGQCEITVTENLTSQAGNVIDSCENSGDDAVVVLTVDVCIGDSVTLELPGSGSYTWAGGSASASETYGPPPVGGSAVNVAVSATGMGCGSFCGTIQLNPIANPVVTVTDVEPNPDQVLNFPYQEDACVGDAYDFIADAGAGHDYLWLDFTGVTFGDSLGAFYYTGGGFIDSIYIFAENTTTGCIGGRLLEIDVSEPPTASITPSPTGTVCPNTSVTLSDGSGCSGCDYTWHTVSGGVFTATGTPDVALTVTPSTTTEYAIIVTNSAGCKDTAYYTLNVFANPTPTGTITVKDVTGATSSTSTSPVIVCTNDSLRFNGGGGASYAWSIGSVGGTSSPDDTYIIAPSTNTTYHLVVTDANNCTATLSMVVDPNQAPSATIDASSVSICSGQGGVSLTAQCTDCSGAKTYAWEEYNTATMATSSVGGGNSSFNITPTDASDYTLTLTRNSTGCKDTSIVSIAVGDSPDITLSASQDSICENELVTLTAALATGSTAVGDYQWLNSSNSVIGALGPSNTFDQTPTAAATIVYKAVGFASSSNCPDTATVTVVVSDVPSAQLADASECVGTGNVVFGVNVGGGTSPFSYVWDTVGVSSASLNFATGSFPVGTYNYNVTVTDAAGCTATDGGTFELDSCVFDIVTYADANFTNLQSKYCVGDTMYLQAVTDAAIPSYDWSSGETTQGITVIPSLTDSFIIRSVTIRDNGANGRVIVDTIFINRPDPVLLASPSGICSGDSTIIEVISCNSCDPTFNEFLGAPSSIHTISFDSAYADPSLTTTYLFEVTDSFNCVDTASIQIEVFQQPNPNILPGDTAQYCATDVAPVDANPDPVACIACTYLWSNGATTQSTDLDVEGMYYVSVTTAEGCEEIDSVYAEELALPEPIIYDIEGPDTIDVSIIPPTGDFVSLCDGGTDTLYVYSCDSCSFEWGPSAGSATTESIVVSTQGSYYVVATDTNGCVGTSGPAIVLNSVDGNNSVAVATPEYICNTSEDSALLSITPACVGCQYNWYLERGNNDSLFSSSREFYTDTIGTYYAIVTNGDNCSFVTNTVTLSALTVTIPAITLSSDSICPGQSVTLSTIDNPAYQYQWYEYDTIGATDTTIISFATSSSYTTPDIGYYIVDVTYDNGCSEMSDTVVVASQIFIPEIYFASDSNITTSVVCPGDSVEIETELVPGYTYQWYKDGIIIPGANSSSYFATSSGVFNVDVLNNNGCQSNSSSLMVVASTLNIPNLSYGDVSICPGDSAEINVSLCVGCDYDWYNVLGLQVDSNTVTYNAMNVGSYYAVVTGDQGCSFSSDTVEVTYESVLATSLNPSSFRVCNGVEPRLTIGSCTGCSYEWLLDNMVIATAQNDTFHDVLTAAEVGVYNAVVTDDNGCRDTSNSVTIFSGRFAVDLTVNDPTQTICNSTGDILTATDTSGVCPGGGCLYTWFQNTNAIGQTGTDNFTVTAGGVYDVRITNQFGCYEDSDTLIMNQVDLYPVITSDVGLLCGGAPATMEVTTCPTCTYQWQEFSTGTIAGATDSVYVTNAVGTYTVSVTTYGCSNISGQQVLNPAAPLDLAINVTDTSICNGDSITLFRISGNSASLSFQWLRDSIEIPNATAFTYSTDIPGDYNLVAVASGSNCIDTSAVVFVREVPGDPLFELDLSAFTPLPFSSSTPLNMDLGLQPASLQGGAFNGDYENTPLSALGNATLSGTHDQLFTPNIAGSGFHLIKYSYDSLGCTFSDTALIRVLDGQTLDIVNTNILSEPYEACVNDTLILQFTNMPYHLDSVYVFDEDGVYQSLNIVAQTSNVTYFGADSLIDGSITVVVPIWAKESYLQVLTSTLDTITTPYLLIHNEVLSYAGLPSNICSNGDPVGLTATPSGGYLTAFYPNGSAVGASFFTGIDSIDPVGLDATNYTQDSMDITIFYNYTYTYTNGNACSYTDTVSQVTTARSVEINSVQFNTISESQSIEQIENLVYQVNPYTASPSRWQHGFGFGGSFTTPVGAPTDFQPSNAGVGTHTLSYTIYNGVCSNTVSNDITVVAEPTQIAVADTICRTNAPVAFGRDGSFTYLEAPPSFLSLSDIYEDTFNIMTVTSLNTNQGLTVTNGNVGFEQLLYTPANFTGNHDTIEIEYIFRRVEYDINGAYDTVEYVVASVVQPIYIEDTLDVEILDTIVNPVYCEDDVNYLLAATPTGGVFTLMGGTGAYAAGDTVDFDIFNPFAIHGPETVNTNYTLVYNRPGVVCQNIDSMNILITEPLDPSFATQSGDINFCDSDPADSIIVATPTDLANGINGVWLIGGVAQQDLYFDPIALLPDRYVVEYQVSDIYGCLNSAIDTFEVYELPVVFFDPAFDPSYCTNDSSFTFEVNPSPVCGVSVGSGTVIVGEDFESGVMPPTGWERYNIAGPGVPQWEPSTTGGNTGPNAAFINTGSLEQNSWLIKQTIPMSLGNIYRVQYYVKVGPENCPGCDNASMRVTMSSGTTVNDHLDANQTDELFDAEQLTNEIYIPLSHDFICPADGNYTLAFNATSGDNLPRTLFLDDITITEISATNCTSGGIGTLFADGMTYQGDSTYLFEPTTLSPGNYDIKYVYVNTNGCLDSAKVNYDLYQHVTPTIMNLDSSYCVNSPTDTLSTFPADGDFGSGFISYDLATGGAASANLQSSPTDYYDPNTPTEEVVQYTYVDPNTGCIDIDLDTIEVLDMPDSLTFKNLLPAYCEDETTIILDTAILAGAPLGGYYLGNGIVDGNMGPGVAYFSPDSAVAETGRTGDFVITHIWPLANGCVDTTRATVRVNALPDLTFTNLPDSICLNANDVQIIVNNHIVSGALGEIETDSLLPVGGGTYTSAIINSNDSLVPTLTGAGFWPVEYSYTDANACTSIIYDTVRVDTVPEIYFAFPDNTPDSLFCENEDPSVMLAFPSYYPGSGYLDFSGQQLNQSHYEIDPAVLATHPTNALYPLFYTFTDFHGCTGTGTDSIEVRPYPRITLTIPTAFCNGDDTIDLNQYVLPTGGVFSDDLPVPAIINGDSLDLTLDAGPRRITYYYYDSLTGCDNSEFADVDVYNTPDIDFIAYGGCVDDGVRFEAEVSNFDSNIDTISNITWDFDDGTVISYLPNIATPTEIPDTSNTYLADGVYNVVLTVENQGLCLTTFTKPVIVSPKIANYPYFEDFETGPAGWYADQPITIADTVWEHGFVVGDVINDPTNSAWVTELDAPYDYAPDSRGWVYSPCFDMNPLDRPMIAMDMWRDLNPGIDGAVMEYYDYDTDEWRVVGQANRGVNWYPGNIILSRPGNQSNVSLPTGWTGETGGWTDTRYRLDGFMYQDNIRFRIAFAGFNTPNLDENEGVAFDNIWVGDRTRNVLVEFFSNQNYTDAALIDNYVYDLIFTPEYGRDVSLIQYQTDAQGVDPRNDENPSSPATRALVYGVETASQPSAMVDGLPVNNGLAAALDEYSLDWDMLQFPQFDIDITGFSVLGSDITVTSTVTALDNMPIGDYRLYTVITEDTLLNSNLNHYQHAINRRIMGGPEGEDIATSWVVGQTHSSTQNWDSAAEIGTFSNASDLVVVTFVQDMNTEEVFQVASTRDITIYFPDSNATNIEEVEIVLEDTPEFEVVNLNLYPNPAMDYFNIEFDVPLEGDYDWRLVDVMGRTVQQGNAGAGTELFTVETPDLPAGAYFFVLNNENILIQRQVIIRRP